MATCHRTHCDVRGEDFDPSAKRWAPHLGPADSVPLGLGPRQPPSPCRDSARPRSLAPGATPFA
eukprot:9409543-Pyramimonas_sp.AAC.1